MFLVCPVKIEEYVRIAAACAYGFNRGYIKIFRKDCGICILY